MCTSSQAVSYRFVELLAQLTVYFERTNSSSFEKESEQRLVHFEVMKNLAETRRHLLFVFVPYMV